MVSVQYDAALAITWTIRRTSKESVWQMSKCGVLSGPYILVFIPKTGKYRPEKTLHLDTFQAASIFTRNWASNWWSLEDDSVNYHLFTKWLKMKPHSISSIYFPRQLPHNLTETLKMYLYKQFHWQFVITFSGFWLVDILFRKFDTSSQNKWKW